MSCATEDEIDLIRRLDAIQYADPAKLCSTSCRKNLDWWDWETDLSKATYEILRNLENILRIAISSQLSAHYSREDWWNAPGLRLTHGTNQKIAQAKDKLVRASVPLTPTSIQREMTLGFWVMLLGRGADYETQLWRPVKAGFPGYRGTRVPLHARLDRLRELRNKVAHQERIGDWGLASARNSVLTAIGYVSEVAARRVDAADTALPELLALQPEVCLLRTGGTS